jgi:ubiquinone/menaquinone biosynthesis C-methylase UbiE
MSKVKRERNASFSFYFLQKGIMDHQDHVALIQKGIPQTGGVWADLGSGRGAFTLAVAELIGREGVIYSIDKDRGALREQEQAMKARFPDVTVHYQQADFTDVLNIPPLDGVVMANSLHFHRHKEPILRRVYNYLKPGGVLILVEYNVDSGNMWVPYPFSYPTWERLAATTGFVETRLLATYPSSWLREIYAAASKRP